MTHASSAAQTIDFFWRLPTHGDISTVRRPQSTRGDWWPLRDGNQAPGLLHGEPDGSSYIDHLAQIAKAAEIPSFPRQACTRQSYNQPSIVLRMNVTGDCLL